MTRARRASRPRFRLLPTVLLTLLILGVPTVVYAWGRSSSSFDIATVRVAGAHLVPDKRALRLLNHDYRGRNLFTVTGGDVRKTLEPLHFVSGATVNRDFPNTLSVTITEYAPAAYALAGGRLVRPRRERLRHLHRRRMPPPSSPRPRRRPPAPRPRRRRRLRPVRRGRRRPRTRPQRPVPPLLRHTTPTPRPGVSSPARSRPRCRCPASRSPAASARAPSSVTRRPPRCCA